MPKTIPESSFNETAESYLILRKIFYQNEWTMTKN